MKVTRRLSYPYTLHFDVNDVLKSNAAMPQGDLRCYHTFKRTDLRQFRDALDLVVGICRMADLVGMFAMGGMAPLVYMLERLGAYQVQVPSKIQRFTEKFHVFGGLNWTATGDENKRRFLEWIQSAPPGSQVLLFDTGKVGNAAGQVFNLLKQQRRQLPKPLTIQVIVIGQNDRVLPTDHAAHEYGELPERLSLIKDIVRVPDTATEDALYLAGYEKSRDALCLDPINVRGSFLVELENGEVAIVSSLTTGQAFISLLTKHLETLSVLSSADILLVPTT